MDKRVLEGLLDEYNWWMGLSTVGVAIGILGEYVAHFIFEKEARRDKLEMVFSILFGVLVLGGVVGEYIFGSKLSNVAGQLQREADGEVAKLNKSAAYAAKDAAEAHKEADSFQSQIADANARASSAEAVVASANAASRDAVLKVAAANVRIAEAERRAAEANKIAEGEKLARLQIEERLAPRSLTNDQIINISKTMAPLGAQNIDFFVYPNDVEIMDLAQQIAGALQGWTIKGVQPLGGGPVSGILVEYDPSDLPASIRAKALVGALTICGLKVGGPTPTLPTPADKLPAFLGSGPIVASIRLTVGKK